MKLLFKLMSGRRGRRGSAGFCDRMDFKEIHYYGDQRDFHGVRTVRSGRDLTSIWTVPTLVDKALRFQYEALEILFPHPSNITTFHPALMPIFSSRGSLICQQMIDRLSDRAIILKDKGLVRRSPYPYDKDMLIDGLDILQMARQILLSGQFYPQTIIDESSVRAMLELYEASPAKIESHFNCLIADLRRSQLEWTRAKNERERRRGEGPIPRTPALLERKTRDRLTSLGLKVLETLKGDVRQELSPSEIDILYGHQDRAGLHYYAPDEPTEDYGEVEEAPIRAAEPRMTSTPRRR